MARDIYTEIIKAFNHNKVAYTVIGVSGINYYTKDAHSLIMTADYDIFLKPEVENVTKAIKILKAKGFTVVNKEGPIRRISKKRTEEIVRKKLNLTCENFYGNMIDLCLEVSGFGFEELDRKAKIFKAGRTSIRVGRLRDLLKTKEIAARPKDRLFLEKYKLLLKEE